MLIDLSSGQTLFKRDPERRFMPASTTKIMTVYTAFELISHGKLKLDETIEISPEIAEEWSGEGSSMFLKAGDHVTIAQLMTGITTVSGNDACVALAVHAAGSLDKWLAMMNENAAFLGMKDSHFGSPNGYPDEGKTFTSAQDLAILASALVKRHPDLYQRFFGHHGMVYNGIAQSNHDPITGKVPGADGIKTGYTRQAGYNFVGSAFRSGRRLIMVLAGSPTSRMRDETARKLINWGYDDFENRLLVPARAEIGTARVQDGALNSVTLRPRDDVVATVPVGGTVSPKLTIRYRGPVKAPIAKGQEVARLHIEIPGQTPHEVPLVASHAVARANMLQRLVNGVEGFWS
ncbi:D-alanyl-D-alanine carboxypeptidase [Altericroceibacterium spongiae]|uniref:serine-type D-Ala-D-Ala carboxypeptidase n=1 Tax=Altericroceibacterium spongiae TaxID=2320269 RepID=A0A420ESE8_9SPHN|nr:D-alanyl-D-alanine carboxypeptidase [Altericroceibacterium spongiae]